MIEAPDDIDVPGVPDWAESLLEQYGIGVPFVIFAVGAALFVRTAPGIFMFGRLSLYGQVGAVVMATLSIGLLSLSGWLYHEVDFELWLMTQDSDDADADDPPAGGFEDAPEAE